MSSRKIRPRQLPIDLCSLDANEGQIRIGGLAVERYSLAKKRWVRVYDDDCDPGTVWLQFSEVSDGDPSWRRLSSIPGTMCRRFYCSGVFNSLRPKSGHYRMSRDKSGLLKIYVKDGFVSDLTKRHKGREAK